MAQQGRTTDEQASKRRLPGEKKEGGDAEEKRYKCEKCGATFTDADMLENHKKVHKDAGNQQEAQQRSEEKIEIPPAEPREDGQVPKPPPPTPRPNPSPVPQPVQ